ncbi:Profilin domain protein, partial [Monkeypox virus]
MAEWHKIIEDISK